MREILFRGKFGNEWKYGYLTIEPQGLAIKEPYVCGASHIWCIDPETVGQYTGLNDKNGTKIFEGDILKLISDNEISYYDVVYPEADCRWIIRQNGLYQYQDVLDKFVERYMTVAGNIYDNPELLEESEWINNAKKIGTTKSLMIKQMKLNATQKRPCI